MVKGEKVLLKLENEKIIELVLEKDVAPVADVLKYGPSGGPEVIAAWVFDTEVDEKIMKRLSHSIITDVKATIHGKDFVLDQSLLKKKQVTRIMNAAQCIAGTTNEQ